MTIDPPPMWRKTRRTDKERRRRILRIEVGSCVGCAALGTVLYSLAGSTLRDIWLPLLGWAAGCSFHLAQLLVAYYLAAAHSRLRARRDASRAPD
jgi:hypothetical protein